MRRLHRPGLCARTARLLSNTSQHVKSTAVWVDVVTLPTSPPPVPPCAPLASATIARPEVLAAAPAPPPPTAPEVLKSAPAAPAPPPPTAPEVLKSAPAAPATPPPTAPEVPKSAPAAPAPPPPTAPEVPKSAPAAPAPPPPTAPEVLKSAPAAPATPPPTAAEVLKSAPAAPAPPPPTAAEVLKSAHAAPAPPPPTAPEVLKSAPAAPAPPPPTAPEVPKSAPAAPAPPPPTAPEVPKSAPAAPAPPPPTAPEVLKSAPAAPAPPPPTAPEVPKSAPAAPTPPPPTAPEVLKSAPAAPATPPPTAPEVPKSAPAAPAPPPPTAPEVPKSAPAAPAPPPPTAPEVPKSAPAAPAPPPPTAPEVPKSAPAAPAPPPPTAPEVPKSAPAAPAPPPPTAPEVLKSAPAAPAPPPPTAPEVLKSAPAAPAPPPPTAPEVPKSAPAAPAPPPPTAAEVPKSAPASRSRLHSRNSSSTGRSKTAGHSDSSSPGARLQVVARSETAAKHTKAGTPLLQQGPRGAVPQPSVASPLSSPPPPPPAPEPSAAPPAPPPPVSRSSAHATIAPPSRSDAVEDSGEVEEKLFEALRPSLSTRIEAAVQHGKATHPLKVSRSIEQPQAEKLLLHIPRESTETPACGSGHLEGAAPGDWAFVKREERLHPLPKSISESIDQHEIPVELGGDGPAIGPESTTSRFPANRSSRGSATAASADAASLSSAIAAQLFETPIVERLPGDVWCGAGIESGESGGAPSPSNMDNSDVCVSVSTCVTPQQCVITVQLREPPSNSMAAVKAVAGALIAVESHCNAAVAANAPVRIHSAPKGVSDITVTWCTLQHCPFFTAAESPAELSLSQRVCYMEAKESVMKRFHHLVARYGTHVRFAAVATTGSVLDFGAEVFFACPDRRLISPRGVISDGSDEGETPLVSSSPPSVGAVSVGFPLSRVGIFPSTSTVALLQRLCGSFHTVKWVPVLHMYDARSLARVGLLSLSDAPADSLEKSTWKQWWLRLEEIILERLCQSPTQRQWVMETFLWSRGFHTAAVRQEAAGTMSADILDGWYAYAMGVLGRDPSCSLPDAVCGEGAEKATGVYKLLATPPCRGASHAVHVHTRSLRQSLPSLPHHRFLAFQHSQKTVWNDKVKSLITTEDSVGAAILLDCSEKAVMDTLDLVRTHLTGASELRTRLPYLNVVLVGEAAAAQSVLQYFPCAAVISSASAFCEVGHASVQQVRLYASPKWPTDLQQDTLLSALTYLKCHGTPHVVASSAAPHRLLLALCEEAVLIARLLSDATTVESVAREDLGLCLGPFQLMDAYGTAAVASMAAEERSRIAAANDMTARVAVAPVHQLESCMRSMAREGLLGSKSARGGFYDPVLAVNGGGAASPQLRKGVLSAHISHYLTPSEVRDRLRAAVLNVACELLTHGDVQGADDIDLLSMSALGWRKETGGVLYQIDELGADGLPRLVEKMGHLAAMGVAVHLAPHPLLLRMVTEKIRFANLKTSGLL
ncbi:hypothetical protein JKF63_01031 [Porcisia hertigi]|uniref:3-hydroxyacyl-CoA dehydrogenase C-terminal domain-containing protein n=1 Tax=Porcisia hertigi TaxID=2761500 RepID=A0A836I2Y2_9TRYP|nr:hypothetical protein JKF63_01031 [Porcisia hertigi]